MCPSLPQPTQIRRAVARERGRGLGEVDTQRAIQVQTPVRITLRALVLCGSLLVAASVLRAQTPDHPEQYAPADVLAGARIYTANCANCHGATGAGVGIVDLRRRSARTATDASLAALISNGIPGSGMVAVKLDPAEVKALVAFVRTGLAATAGAAPVPLGDAVRGKTIFEGAGNCLGCHRVNDRGSFAAPDLSDIGQIRTAIQIQRSLIDPDGSMWPINRPVRAVLRDGTAVAGRRLNEDSYTVQVITDAGRLVSLVKSELKAWSVGSHSTMPSAKTMQPDELADLMGYLMSLKAPQQ
jgi:cytochrome c oxidase cbb3-type subunit III